MDEWMDEWTDAYLHGWIDGVVLIRCIDKWMVSFTLFQPQCMFQARFGYPPEPPSLHFWLFAGPPSPQNEPQKNQSRSRKASFFAY